MTAGPDERLRVIPGGGPETEAEAEARIRAELHRRGLGPGGPASSPPPMPSRPPRVPAQPDAADVDQEPGEEPEQAAPAKALNDRLVDWWSAHKPHLADDDGDDGEEEPDDDGEEEPAARGPRPHRGRVSKRPAKDDDEDGDGDEDEDEPDDEDAKGKKSKKGKGKKGKRKKGKGDESEEGPRWSRPVLGRPPGLPAEKHNLFTWWRGMEPHTKWLMYHGTGLGAGLYFGVPAYGYEGHRFIADNPAGDLEVWATWGLLVLLLMADYRVRNLFPPLAWAVRALSTSVIVGALWYGTPLADLDL
ncbi:hypothetical protein [Streptomyces sp. SAI-127]|uniref:hypothetical protein n=1 Tax=Streptomyces sp. SAI-127 TaxID=2940543 RepID=UPI002473F457|nr:hypothetical protein [Streptomyces sp. SAI-127]MDH6489617.1 hypothetical protein [Streptomyces sp. SAI-127]